MLRFMSCPRRPSRLMAAELLCLIWALTLFFAWHCIVASQAFADCHWSEEFLGISVSLGNDKPLFLLHCSQPWCLLSLSSRSVFCAGRLFT